ncbi:MAG: thiamine pyrophosphate-dependent dehydrogenase E1 component subunit alpha [Pseudomonadota bacterium]
MKLEKEYLMKIYGLMKKIRLFEERTSQLFLDGKIPGFIHTSLGQESVAVGVRMQLKSDDYVLTTHRGHGHMIAKGAESRPMMAELFGRADGYCKGRGGSMHIAHAGIGVLGANGIVGGGLPIAAGAAFSAQYRGTDQIAVCLFGDGATNEGTFHESLNLAAVWKLPVVFVCENNGWANFTCQGDSICLEDIANRAQSYGMPGQTVDGINVLDVMEAAREAIERARSGGGPTLLEVKTQRWHGHYEGDSQKYRNEEELKSARSQDPVEFFRNHVLKEKLLDEGALEKIDQELVAELDEAVKYAENSPIPGYDNETQQVYA